MIVLYKGKYGSTRQYAEWIADELDAAGPLSVDEATAADILPYATVIVGGAVRMGKITAANFLMRHWPILRKKRVILFSFSASPPWSPETEAYLPGSLPEEIRDAIRWVPLWGRSSDLDAKDRLLILFPKAIFRLRMLRDKTGEARARYEGLRHPFDHVARDNIAPVLAACDAAGS
jgi:hypothetical protein